VFAPGKAFLPYQIFVGRLIDTGFGLKVLLDKNTLAYFVEASMTKEQKFFNHLQLEFNLRFPSTKSFEKVHDILVSIL